MSIVEIESDWHDTDIACPFCNGGYTAFSDGESRPQCSNILCKAEMPDEYIWQWLITKPEFHEKLRKYAKHRFEMRKLSDKIMNREVV